MPERCDAHYTYYFEERARIYNQHKNKKHVHFKSLYNRDEDIKQRTTKLIEQIANRMRINKRTKT